MRIMLSLALAAGLISAPGAPVQARARHGMPKARFHLPHPHGHRAPHGRVRTVRVRAADGTVMTGYRDSLGTHLRGPDGRTVHCQRQAGAADIDVACR